ncbi:uncharacterized protein LOC122257689 [Penaeus japonicus]|uniref:uncharacterized protein LOC122257689 n=1 Tax=Penaeus japonicus TaxID=27405 RepID=UPI001C70EBB6|nr:uncharacterized protein LOC122257689 [Penaeus japonicus]
MGIRLSRFTVRAAGTYYDLVDIVEDSWNQLCFGLNTESMEVRGTVEGGAAVKRRSEEDLRTDQSESEFCFGSRRGVSSLVGFIAAVSVTAGWPDDFNRSCSSLVSNAKPLFANSSWSNRGNAMTVDYKEEELCSQSSQNLLLQRVGNYNESLDLCKAFGGSLLTEENVTEGVIDVGDFPTSSLASCSTKEEFMAWLFTQPSDAEHLEEECFALKANGSIGSRPCVSELECSICRMPDWVRYTLYGDIGNFDRYYFLKSSPEGGFYFEGIQTSYISEVGDAWHLWSRLHRRSWQLTEQEALPLGRRQWHSKDKNATFTLTSCSVMQFSTNDGLCLPASQRCDGKKDSADDSDEWRCRERLVEKQADYDPTVPPTNGTKAQGVVFYEYDLFNINHITSEEGVALLDMGFTFQWRDHRVTLWDAGKSAGFFPCEEIWYPKLGMLAGYKTGAAIEVECYSSQCFVEKNQDAREQLDLRDPLMGRSLPGSMQNLSIYSECRVTIPCNFKFHRFPFGSHMCNGTFYFLKASITMLWRRKASVDDTTYDGDKNLLDFRLLNVTSETTVTRLGADLNVTFTVLTLHLRSLFDYHLLNSFGPSALMFIICYTTLFIPINDFNERIMVSLTAMLVLAALFSQATSSYVRTPYFKLIDIWYAVIIALCFIVVLVNVGVNRVRLQGCPYQPITQGEGENSKSLAKETGRADRTNMLCKVIILAVFGSLVAVFVMFATEVF